MSVLCVGGCVVYSMSPKEEKKRKLVKLNLCCAESKRNCLVNQKCQFETVRRQRVIDSLTLLHVRDHLYLMENKPQLVWESGKQQLVVTVSTVFHRFELVD